MPQTGAPVTVAGSCCKCRMHLCVQRQGGSECDLGQHYAVGMLFLSRDNDLQQHARDVMESALNEEGLAVFGWRVVPIDESVCGEIALDQLPRIEQVFVDANGIDHEHCLGKLYTARRKAEMALADDQDFYICSLSDRVVSYKGLVMPADLERFYPDLNNPALAICVFHQRFSTNTPPVALRSRLLCYTTARSTPLKRTAVVEGAHLEAIRHCYPTCGH